VLYNGPDLLHEKSGFFLHLLKVLNIFNVLKVGLTGGIGSGKSTVAAIFEVIGIPVYYADAAAKRLMNENQTLKLQIIQLFGDEAYKNGQLDRAFIASRVFNDAGKLEELNKIVHPITISDAEKWMAEQKGHYAIKEAAIIFESGSNSSLDKVIGVFAPEDTRVKRVMERDNVTAENVKKRMSNQMNEDAKMQLCDYVIYNDETRFLIPQVIAIHQQLLEIR
jgi:dephospho-CoA kinase